RGACRFRGERRRPTPRRASPRRRRRPPPARLLVVGADLEIGPGAGVTPFRGFPRHRALSGHPGRNWLFFGDRNAATDFLYRDELEQMRRDGVLTRLDTAFSRDQDRRIYVQDRMREHGASCGGGSTTAPTSTCAVTVGG